MAPESSFEDEYGTETRCPESAYGRHELDPGSLTVEHDGEFAYIDCNCIHCGRSGCIGSAVLHDNVDW